MEGPQPPPRISPSAAAMKSWANVPDDIVIRVSAFLPCRADRVHMAAVNKHWRAALRVLGRPPPPEVPPLPELPPQLPWLIFPSTVPSTFYSVLGDSYRRLYGLPPDVSAARCCGSGDGGWLFLAFAAPHAHALYNLNSGTRIPLPPGFRSPFDDAEFPLVLNAATLSASPSNGTYVVAAIALVDNRPTAAFWTPGRDSWFSTGGPLAVMPQDVIYFGGAFYFLTPSEELIVFRAARGPNGDVNLGPRLNLDMRQRADYGADIGVVLDVGGLKRYLVESGGRLLMVVRYVIHKVGRLGTKALQVFRLCASASVGHRRAWTWEHIDKLDGRMVFLGPGCSRSFEVAGYDGFRESEIYFLDDSFFAVPAVDDDDADADAGSEDDADADADAGLEDDADAGLEDDVADAGSSEDAAASADAGSLDVSAGTGSVDDDDEAESDDDDGGDDAEAGSVANNKPDTGKYTMGTEKPKPWPPGCQPRSDAPPTWWLH